MRRASSFVLCLVCLASCSAFKKATGQDGGGGQGWSDSAATAPSFEVGKTVQVKAPPCNAGGYFKVNVAPGTPFHITATASQAGSSCGYFEVQTGAGQTADTAGASTEVCAESGPRTIESKGQQGGTLVQVSEKFGCAGITVAMALQDGPAPADAGASAAPADGPQPEN